MVPTPSNTSSQGASAVSVGTATFHDPGAALRIQNELSNLLGERGFTSLKEAIAHAHRAGDEEFGEG